MKRILYEAKALICLLAVGGIIAFLASMLGLLEYEYTTGRGAYQETHTSTNEEAGIALLLAPYLLFTAYRLLRLVPVRNHSTDHDKSQSASIDPGHARNAPNATQPLTENATITHEYLSRSGQAVTTAIDQKQEQPLYPIPWKRFAARFFDEYAITIMPILIAKELCILMNASAYWLVVFVFMIIIPLYNIFEATSIALTKTTPGKWLLGISVTRLDKTRLSYIQSLARSFRVWLYGRALDIPPFNLIAVIAARNRFVETNTTSWDEAGAIIVYQKPISMLRVITFCVLLFLIVYITRS